MEVKIKKLRPEAIIPKYALDGDAGLDLTNIGYIIEDTMITYSTGLAIEIPKGYVGLIFPRSSICKKDLMLTNSVGVVDENFRGEIKFKFKSTINGVSSNIYNYGDRIGQLIIMPYPKIEFKEVEKLSDSNRGTGSFGSTGT